MFFADRPPMPLRARPAVSEIITCNIAKEKAWNRNVDTDGHAIKKYLEVELLSKNFEGAISVKATVIFSNFILATKSFSNHLNSLLLKYL